MIAEIESILNADDAAREEVEAARAESKRLKDLARKQAGEIVSEKKRELAESIGTEEKHILEEARLKSEKLLDEASHYIQGLEDRKNAMLTELVGNLLEKVTGT